MPSLEVFANLGIAGISLGIIYVMLQYFMKTLSRKDEESRVEREVYERESKALIADFKQHIEMCNTNFIKVNNNTTKVLKTVAENLRALQSNPVTEQAAQFMIDKGKKIDEIYTKVVHPKS